MLLLFVLPLAGMAQIARAARDTRGQAQAGEGSWTAPSNLSRSGAASLPVIAAAPDGTLYALWWDRFDGELFSRGTGITETEWTRPATVPQIFGESQVDKDTGAVTLFAPQNVRAVADVGGTIYAFWLNTENQLLSTSTQGHNGWSAETLLSEAALNLDAASDLSGRLHVAYVRSVNTVELPAGVYYRSAQGGDWSSASLVYASLYFRGTTAEEAHVSVAGDGLGRVLVAWDDLLLGQSNYAISTDGGDTWGEPQHVSGLHARVASAPNGEFLLLWQDLEASEAGGCGLTQSRSGDGGQSWSAPERVLAGIGNCPGRWQFGPAADGQLWLVGMPPVAELDVTSATAILAAWNGTNWSQPASVNLTFRDPATDKLVSLGCLSLGLNGNAVGVLGCDASGDVWALRNTVDLNALVAALQPVWSPPEAISPKTRPAGIPALAADQQGKLYAVWSESGDVGEPGQAVALSKWESGTWSRGGIVLRSGVEANQPAGKADQPTLAADNQGRLHAVWSGGASGEIFYSWTYGQDATLPEGWSRPVLLPAPVRIASAPDIVADPRGNVLHVLYAVPFNEQRGIYYVRSTDDGATWGVPVQVFDAAVADWDSADRPRLSLDPENNILHAVWVQSVLPTATGTQAIYYARSTDDGQTWSSATFVADGLVDWPRLAIPGPGEVYLGWNQEAAPSAGATALAELWGQYSPDAGLSWSEAERVPGLEGLDGPAGLAADGGGGLLAAAVGQGVGGDSILLFSRWDGQAWGEREIFGLGQDAAPGSAATLCLMPGSGSAKLFVAMREFVRGPDGVGQYQIVATVREVSVEPVAPPPTFTPPPPTAGPATTGAGTPTVRPTLKLTGTPAAPPQGGLLGGQEALVVGGALGAFVVLLVIGRVVWMTRR